MNKVGTRKNGLPDCRFRFNRTLAVKDQRFWQKYGNYIAVALLGALAGIILTKSLWDSANKPLINPRVLMKPDKVEAVEPITWNNAIRQVFPNDEAGRMIRICLKEHQGWRGDPKYALNDKNSNGSWDYGWCQVNSCHKPKTMTNSEWKTYLEDPMNHAKEVRRIFLSQGWYAWSVYKFGLVK